MSTCSTLQTLVQSVKKVFFLGDCSRKMAFWLSLELELTTSSLRQDSSWACFSTSVSLPCINPQALIRTISWNQRKSRWTCIWTKQDFSSITGSNLPFAVSAYWMGKKGQKSPNVYLACLLSVACYDQYDGHPKDWPKCFIVDACSLMSIWLW